MAWFDKALKSVQSTAEKTAFEADKVMRVRREEGALAEAQKRVQGKLADLGQLALSLYRSGALADPKIAALADEIKGLEAAAQLQADKVEAVRSEQYQGGATSGGAATGPVAPPAAAPAAPPVAAAATEPPADVPAAVEAPPAPPVAAAVKAEAPVAAATVECPNCHSAVKATVTFCPECGNKLK